MADFNLAFKKTIDSEGGYVKDPQDPGGETYKGIARKRNSKWTGWVSIDKGKNNSNFPECLDSDNVLQELIKEFYQQNYWDTIQGDNITSQQVAESIFDFGVNAGVRTSSKLAQLTVGANPDGVIGSATIETINHKDTDLFLAQFALAKVARYIHICEKRTESRKYFFGWVRRTLEGI